MSTAITSILDTVELNNGVHMPWFGLGVFKAEDGAEVEQAVRWALDLGYRSIDTAAIYRNEAGVGRAIRESGFPREDLFITTKVWNSDQGYDATLKAFDDSLAKLGLEYIDLYLIHWPVQGTFIDTWRAFEALYRDGRAKAIGVSNFMIPHLEELLAEADVVPAVNQYEFHPRLAQPDLLEFCLEKGIRPEAWSPIMRGQVNDIPELKRIAEKYGKTPVQLVLRWDLQKGVVTIPKSVNRDRIEANADIFDFEISAEDMAAIDALDRGERIGPDPFNFNF